MSGVASKSGDRDADGPFRILFINHVARLSGGEIALERILAALGGSVTAFVILGEDGPLVERLRAVGAHVEVIYMTPRLRDARKESIRPGRFEIGSALDALLYVRRLRRRVRELAPDVIHTNSLKAAFYGGVAGRLSRVPVVWHIRDRIAVDYLPRAAVVLVRIASLLLPTAIVANSNTTLATLPQRRHSRVIYGLVNDPLQTPAPARRESRPLTIGVVGRLARWKGQHVFLEAFAAFRGEPIQARIIGSAMFGEEAYEAQLRDQVARLALSDQVEFRGFRDDIWRELHDLDILVHCSITPEPFGQVVVEGMAAGLPVVAAASGGPTEVIEHNVDGLLSPPGNATQLALILRRLVDDPDLRLRLGTEGRRTSKRFNPQRSADQLNLLYGEVLARAKPRRRRS